MLVWMGKMMSKRIKYTDAVPNSIVTRYKEDNIQYLLDQVARLTVENAMLKEKWLAQPEQEPVVWQVIGIAGFMYVYNKPIDQVYLTHTVNALYTAPKREPLGGATINYYLERLGSDTKWDDGFEAGVKWAEKAHGITGVDDE